MDLANWRWCANGAQPLLEQLLSRALDGLAVATIHRGEDQEALAIRDEHDGGLTVQRSSERGWLSGDKVSVSYLGEQCPPKGSPLQLLAAELVDLSADGAELIFDLVAANRQLDEAGAAVGAPIDAQQTLERHPDLRPFLRMFEGLYGVPVLSRAIPADPTLLSLEFPRLSTAEERVSYLGTVDSFSAGIRAHLAALGFGWTSDGVVRVIPPPGVFAQLASQEPAATGLTGKLVLRKQFNLPAREWVDAVLTDGFPVVAAASVGTFTIPVARLVGKLAGLGFPIPLLYLNRSSALLHDMGLHVMAAHAVPREAVEDLRSRYFSAMEADGSKSKAMEWASFIEGPFTAFCVDRLSESDEIGEFRTRFSAGYEELVRGAPQV